MTRARYVPWESQPQELVELNCRLPRPEIAFNAASSDLVGYYDFARGRYDAWVNPAHTIVTTEAGIGIRPNFANTFTRTQPGQTYDMDLAPAFVQATVWIAADLGTHTGATFRLSALSDTSSARAYLNLTSVGLQLVTHISTTNTAVAAADLPRGLVSLGLAVSDAESKVFVNGRLVYTLSHAALSWVARTEGIAFYGIAGSGSEGENRLLHAARWLGVYDEFAEFATADPWQLFAPKTIWVPVSVGGATTHDTTGALTGAGSSVVGTAAHVAKHSTSGALAGPGSSIAGASARTRAHPTSGALTGPGSAVAGTADHVVPGGTHDTSGALTGPGAAIAGTAAHIAKHSTSGALAGSGAALSGTAARVAAAVTHDTSGTLTGPGAVISGNAATGNLIGRKYPRRGRSRPRKTEDVAVENIPKISAKISQEREEITRELAEVQAALVSTKLMSDNSVNRTEKIKKLGDAVSSLESELRVKREEEELFMMLTLMVLED